MTAQTLQRIIASLYLSARRCHTCDTLLLLLWFRELKHRSVQDPNENFKLQEYVKKEMKSSGCCRA